jgi:hypothetical protein
VGPEKAKQAETPVADLRKILDIPRSQDEKSLAKRKTHAAVVSVGSAKYG